MRVLDLFCGAGGAAMGYYRAGFEVVGVDIAPQPRFPFEFHQADALTFPLDGFDLIHASPPCQAYTLCQRIQNREHPDLIEVTRERLRATGVPYVIENVDGAPLIDPMTLCGHMFGLGVYRHRLFETSFPVDEIAHPVHDKPQVKMGRPPKPGHMMHVVGNFAGVAAARIAMEIPWMTRDELRESIPPAYTEYIANCFMAALAN